LASPSSIIDIDSLCERALQKIEGVVLFGLKKQHIVPEVEWLKLIVPQYIIDG
jgi:hypothetical protein